MNVRVKGELSLFVNYAGQGLLLRLLYPTPSSCPGLIAYTDGSSSSSAQPRQSSLKWSPPRTLQVWGNAAEPLPEEDLEKAGVSKSHHVLATHRARIILRTRPSECTTTQSLGVQVATASPSQGG